MRFISIFCLILLSACARQTPIYERLYSLSPEAKLCLGASEAQDVNGLYIVKGSYPTYFEATECANTALEKELRAEGFKDMGLFSKFAAGKLKIASMMDKRELTEEESKIALKGLYSALVEQEDALASQRKQAFSQKMQALSESLDGRKAVYQAPTQPTHVTCTQMYNTVNCIGN